MCWQRFETGSRPKWEANSTGDLSQARPVREMSLVILGPELQKDARKNQNGHENSLCSITMGPCLFIARADDEILGGQDRVEKDTVHSLQA